MQTAKFVVLFLIWSAKMKRSTNGGGENSPKLEGEDDFYELFFAGLEQKENKNLNE